MSYKQIDEQFDEKFSTTWVKSYDSAVGFNPCYVAGGKAYLVNPAEVKSFLHLIYDQAKAEQREEDAKVAEGKKTHNDYSTSCVCDQCGSEREEITHNSTCDSIATAIRQEEV